jgi:hypothetical protein
MARIGRRLAALCRTAHLSGRPRPATKTIVFCRRRRACGRVVKGGQVAGDRQSPSGTSFDPSPQFCVSAVERQLPLTLTGRCWFAPVTVGLTFDTVASKEAGAWAPAPCRLRVEEISVWEHYMLAELDQEWSARLVLHGDFPAGLVPESVLVAQDCPAAGSWERQGTLWVRRQP